MKSQEFVDLLNNNIAQINSDEELLRWNYKEDDYPYLDINIMKMLRRNMQINTFKH